MVFLHPDCRTDEPEGIVADAADILKRGSEDGLKTWTTIGEASCSVVGRLASRVGKIARPATCGAPPAGLIGDAGQAVAESVHQNQPPGICGGTSSA
jgi:hypothetical protein